MSFRFLFWLLMILWLLFGTWIIFGTPPNPVRFIGGGTLLEFILFALLGWKVFGKPIDP